MNLKIRNKITVGLTGGILCGKSTALAAWKKAGAYVLSCDELVREISARAAVQKKIAAVFGASDAAQLARKVFASSSARKKLEAILHPLVYKEISVRLKATKNPVRVVEVPLLFEAHWEKYFDLTVALLTPEKLLAARAKKRGFTSKELVKRAKAQWPSYKKAAQADICIVNADTAAVLSKKIQALHHALLTIYNVK